MTSITCGLAECGIVGIARNDLEAWENDANRKIQPLLLDESDGAVNSSGPGSYTPHAAKTADGKLWFTTDGDGVSLVDPHHLALNTLPPPVHIEQVKADGKTYDAKGGLRCLHWSAACGSIRRGVRASSWSLSDPERRLKHSACLFRKLHTLARAGGGGELRFVFGLFLLEERQQVRVQPVLLRGRKSVRRALVDDELRVLDDF